MFLPCLGEYDMTEVVAAVIYRDDTHFLLCRRPATKARPLQWEFPGGKVEPGETLMAAIEREIREELGMGIAADGVLLSVVHAYPDLTIRLTLLRCRVTEGEPQLLEHVEARFVTREEAASLDLCPADRELLAAF